MNTLIIFLNVISVMWVVCAGALVVWAFVKINTQSEFSRRVDGEYTVRVGPMFVPLTFACIAWLITQFII